MLGCVPLVESQLKGLKTLLTASFICSVSCCCELQNILGTIIEMLHLELNMHMQIIISHQYKKQTVWCVFYAGVSSIFRKYG